MEIRYTTPPNWAKLQEKFELKETDPIYYTYANCIYSPSKSIPSADLIRHEETHAEQQQYSEDVANLWWQNYLHDPEFRLSQEAEAYGAQYRFICEKFKDRNVRDKWLRGLADLLSGKIYGNCVSLTEARKVIKEFSEHGKTKVST